MTIQLKPLTIWKVLALLMMAACVVSLFLPWIDGRDLSSPLNAFHTDCGHYKTTWWTLQIICTVSFCICGLLAVLGVLLDRNTLAFPSSVLVLLVCFFNAMQSNYIGSLQFNRHIHVGTGAWFFLICGILMSILLMVDNSVRGRKVMNFSDFSFRACPNERNAGPSRYWYCTTCGEAQGSGTKFCTRCGTPKP